MGQGVAESEVEGPMCKGSEVGMSLACGRNRGVQVGWVVGSKESGGR